MMRLCESFMFGEDVANPRLHLECDWMDNRIVAGLRVGSIV